MDIKKLRLKNINRNLWKEGTEIWWQTEVIHEVARQMGEKAFDELGNNTVDYDREVSKALNLWNYARV